MAELPPGTVKIVYAGLVAVGVYNCGGELYALEDRCSHDDGPLCEGDWDTDSAWRSARGTARNRHRERTSADAACDRAGGTYPVRVEEGWVKVEVDTG